jgi:hypothetical protein
MSLRAEAAEMPDYSNPGLYMGLTEKDMDQIQQWSWETGIGQRMSFDTWRFRNNADITAFLLKWA